MTRSPCSSFCRCVGTAVLGAASVQSIAYTSVGGWSAVSTMVPVDTTVGFILLNPVLALSGSEYRLTYLVLQEDGLFGPTLYECGVRCVSLDGVNWSDGVEDAPTQINSLIWLRHASGELLLGDVVRFAPAYTGSASQYRDLSADIVQLAVVEKEGAAATITVTLDNTDGHLLGLSCLRVNAALLLSQGFTGTELIGTHQLYVRDWTFVRASDIRQVVITAGDRVTWLERATPRPRLYIGQSVAVIAASLVVAGGIEQPLLVDAATQYTVAVPSFNLQAGESYVRALARLLAIYDGTFRLELRAGSSALGYLEQLHLVAKSAGDAVLHTLDRVVEVLQVTQGGDRANRLAVYWANHSSSYVDQVDFTDLGNVGQVRFAAAVDMQLGNETNAGLRATLEMSREQRFSLSVQAQVAPQPQVEILHVATTPDSQLGATSYRVGELRLTAIPAQARFELRITGGGV